MRRQKALRKMWIYQVMQRLFMIMLCCIWLVTFSLTSFANTITPLPAEFLAFLLAYEDIATTETWDQLVPATLPEDSTQSDNPVKTVPVDTANDQNQEDD